MRRVTVIDHPGIKWPDHFPRRGLVTRGGGHALGDDIADPVRFAPGVGAVPPKCTSVEVDNVWIAWSAAGAERINELEADGWVLMPIAPHVASPDGAIFRARRWLDADGKPLVDDDFYRSLPA